MNCNQCLFSQQTLSVRLNLICTNPESEVYLQKCKEPCELFTYEPGTEKEVEK